MPAAHGAAVQEEAPVLVQVPFVQVKFALPVLVLVEDTVLTMPSSAAPTLAWQVTPGAPVQDTVPPLQGIGDAVPPADGTQAGGVALDHRKPAGQSNPGAAMPGLPRATPWPIAVVAHSKAAKEKRVFFMNLFEWIDG